MVRFEIAGCGVLVTGPLEGVAAYYKEELLSRGYKRKPLANHLRLLGHLSKWMQIQGLEPASLTLAQIEAFLGERRLSHTELFSRRGLGPLLDWLADQDAIPFTAAVPPSVSDPAVLVKFQAYLRGERRLAESTIAASMARARRFWEGYVPATGIGMLTAAAVTKALLDEGLVRRPVSVKAFGYTLRSLLRFAFIYADIGIAAAMG